MNNSYAMAIWGTIEIAIVILFFLPYAMAWRGAGIDRRITRADEKELSLTALNNAINGGLVAVSILLPVSVGIAIFAIEKEIAQAGLPYIKLAVVYFLISLIAAIWNLFRIPTMVQLNTDLAYDRRTAIFEIVQLLFLVFGAGRLFGAVASI